MKSKSKRLIIVLGTLLSTVSVISVAVSTNSGSMMSRLSALSNSNAKWVHYEQRNATAELDGVREYWVQCGGDYQFTAPTSGTIEDASNWNTTEFAENDPRWIKYITDDKAVFYDLSTLQTNSCEIGAGYTTTETPSATEGGVVKALFKKDDNSCWYYGDYLTVTKVINDGATLKDSIWMPNKSENFHGYYVLGQDIPEGFTNDSDKSIAQIARAFAGTLDGRGHTVSNVTSSFQAGIFGTSNFVDNDKGVYGYIKNINFANFSSAAYGLLGWNAQHVRIWNVSITVKNNCYYLLGGSFNGDMDLRNCYFDISAPSTIRVFGQRASWVTKEPHCENVKIKNDLSKTHVFYGNVTEEYTEQGVIWTNTPATKKTGETLYYDIKNKSLYTSELSTDLEGYSFYSDLQGTQPVDFSSVAAGTTKSVYATKPSCKKYELDCLVVTQIMYTGQDFIDWSKNRTSDSDKGYYILNSDVVYPNKNQLTGAHTFAGTFDGRGHTITYTIDQDSNFGLFGNIINATVKNLNVTNINRGFAMAWALWNGHLDNCTFTISDTIGRYMAPLLFYTVRGVSSYKDVVINNKLHTGAPVIGQETIAGSTITYDNVKAECLDGSVMYKTDGDGKGQNPTDIKYKYLNKTYVNYESGVELTSGYNIKFVTGNSAINTAAVALQRNINKDTKLGFAISIGSISADTSIASSSKSIIIGSTKSFTDAGFKMSTYIEDLNASGYVIVTKDNAVYIMAIEDRGYQLAVNKFLELTLGFDCLGLDAYIYTRDEAIIPETIYFDDADIIERKPDAYFDVYHQNDSYSMNYNNRNSYFTIFNNKPIYTDKNGSTSTSSGNYHTVMLILPAPTYYSTHRDWYGDYTGGTGVYADGYEKTAATGAICYTARGNAESYQNLVSTFADNIITECVARNTYDVCIGNTDGDGYCKCDECSKHNPSYNLVHFLNDVSDYIANEGKSITLAFLCYKAFLTCPDDPNLHCADNVIPFVAPIRANYYRPLNDTTYNSTSKTAIEGWADIAKTCYAWLYDTNFRNILYPYNSYQTTVQNIQYLASLGYSMIFPENLYSTGDYGNMTGFSALKFYLEAKAMVDTDFDYQATFDKFFTYYYGKGCDYMKQMYKEVTTFIENRFTATSGGIGFITDNAGNMNTTQEGYQYLYNWNYSDVSTWRTYCNNAITQAADDEAVVKRIRAERVFPNWSLSTLFATQIQSAGLSETIHNELLRDCSELGFTKWKEGDSSYTGGNSNLNAYFVGKGWSISGEKLVYNVSTATINYSYTTALLNGYSYYATEKKASINWSSHSVGDTFVVYAMKDNCPTYLVKVECIY